MDEVELAIKGTVDRWRVERRNAYQIAVSMGNYKTIPSIFEMFPLPYDEELKEINDTDAEYWVNFYNNAIKELN